MKLARPPRPLALLAAATIALAAPASALGAGFSAVLHAPNHDPVANKTWRLTIDVTRGRQKLSGNMTYRFLAYGTVVSTLSGAKLTNHGRFSNGVWRDTIKWPSDSVGHPLTWEIVVSTRYGTDTIKWAIDVRK